MTKKQIETIYNEMIETINTKISLHNKKLMFNNIDELHNEINIIRDKYMTTISNLLFFNIIDFKKHEYAYNLIINNYDNDIDEIIIY